MIFTANARSTNHTDASARDHRRPHDEHEAPVGDGLPREEGEGEERGHDR